MGRRAAVIWHASLSVIAAGLYFSFVLPRWWELTGVTSHTLGTVLRIVAAALIALAALPVVFTWLRARGPGGGAAQLPGVPWLALRMRVWSIAAHVLAGVLIAGTAISEIWFSLDRAGQWLFGIYGAAAAIALLGVGAFYLSFVAELPPLAPEPKEPTKPAEPARSKKPRWRFGKKGRSVGAVTEAEAEAPDEALEEMAGKPETAEVVETAETTEATEATEAFETTETTETTEALETTETTDTVEAKAIAETTKAEAVSEATGITGAGEDGVDTADTADTELVHSAGRHRMPSGKRRRNK